MWGRGGRGSGDDNKRMSKYMKMAVNHPGSTTLQLHLWRAVAVYGLALRDGRRKILLKATKGDNAAVQPPFGRRTLCLLLLDIKTPRLIVWVV